MNTKEQNEIYKCSVCGNIVEVLHVGGGELVCCEKPMDFQEANTQDAATEKHVPVIEKNENGEIIIKIGSVAHPMDEDHYIEWIELITDKKVFRKNLKPGDAPVAKFSVSEDSVSARAYCNIHGLWQSA